MTPKEKAKELINKFNIPHPFQKLAKQCALICVDEILNEYWSHDTKRRDWWRQVKTEIENL
jgi:hypothetical protein